jgi:hypothetical protein
VNRTRFQPALVPEDLGIDLEEDSPDLTDEEVAGAVETNSMDDFVRLAADFVKEIGSGEPHYERRIKSGIFYCRIMVGTHHRIFRIEWVRS